MVGGSPQEHHLPGVGPAKDGEFPFVKHGDVLSAAAKHLADVEGDLDELARTGQRPIDRHQKLDTLGHGDAQTFGGVQIAVLGISGIYC
jgi:hypothetical protein